MQEKEDNTLSDTLDTMVSTKKLKTTQENGDKTQHVLDGPETMVFEQGSETENQTLTDYESPRSHDEGEPTIRPKKKPSSWSILLKAFRELGLPSPSSPDTWLEFASLKKLLYEPKVIVVTTKILNVALKVKDDDSRQRARILLTSYMTLMCPHEVLQDVDGEEERRLHASAQRMLYLFETWLSAHGRPGATAARLRFVDAWHDYFILFEAWKSRDRDQLVNSMIAYYLELLSLKKSTDTQVNSQLDEQLEQVKHKIKDMGGEMAIKSLERAVQLAQQLELAASRSTERKKQSTPRTSTQQAQKEEEKPNVKQLNQVLSDYAVSSNGLNEQIAHELIMDPNFKLTRSSSELEARVRETMQRAYFDKIAQDVEEGKFEESLLPMISDIRERLLSLVRPEGHLYQNINDVIDLPLIEQQMKQKSFDMNGLITFILETMSKICAPVRDDEIQRLINTDGVVERVAGISQLLDSMNLDLANFRLRSLRPHLMSIAVEYERDKFAEMLANGTIQLVSTKKWLHDAVCENQQDRTTGPGYYKSVFQNALVSLLSQPQSISTMASAPETFRLDIKRLTEYQNEMQAITIVASLIFLAKNFGCKDPERLTKLASHLFTILEDDDISIENLIVEIERTVQADDEKRPMIRSMVDKTISHTDTIYLLLFRRVVSVIKSTIQSERFVTDTVISSYSLDYVRHRLEDLSKKVLRLSDYNQKVYATWYDQIISDALK